MPASRIEHACGSSRCYWRRIWPPQLSCPLESAIQTDQVQKADGAAGRPLDSSPMSRDDQGHLIRAI